ncbi:hypothetical protein BCV69DRAFT_81329 [Microstroma glucosiphilum]|uniref:Uncharacterized protein n=1 Tax=Pseudomicrostroma glucosiphilum TaxID=1684307 RepID=A0A316TYK4_9BASI|nr:hypothetical protein BCV69DRAFT_81329 [Pseudomicrostroma glucosiphilum]PWN18302.1 hypothetical protein BCV69DRAFT_81329 [Pseudomicrostroma glucosiphilum]
MRERARQRLPNWLQAELTSSSSAGEVARRHRAHLQPLGDPSDSTSSVSGGPDLLESHLVAERRLRLKRDRRLLKGCRPTSLSIVLSLPLFENQEPALFASMVVFSRCEELDVYMPVPAHAPKLLWLLSHLHRSPLRRIKVTTNHFSLCMSAGPFDQAGEAKRRRTEREERRKRKRWRAQVASNPQEDGEEGSGLSLQPYPVTEQGEDPSAPQQKRPINLATSLRLFLESETIRQALLWEFTGRHYDRPQRLEKVLQDVALKSQDVDPEMFVRDGATSALGSVHQWCNSAGEVLADVLSTSLSLDGTLSASATAQSAPSYEDGDDHGDCLAGSSPLMRVRVLQGNQGGAGKMKDRREDFIERSLGLGEGIWKRCGLWDDE